MRIHGTNGAVREEMRVCDWVLAGMDRDQPCGNRVNLGQLQLLVNLTIRKKKGRAPLQRRLIGCKMGGLGWLREWFSCFHSSLIRWKTNIESPAVRAKHQAISNIKFNVIYVCFLYPSLQKLFCSSHSLISHLQNWFWFIKMKRKCLPIFFTQNPVKILGFAQPSIICYPSMSSTSSVHWLSSWLIAPVTWEKRGIHHHYSWDTGCILCFACSSLFKTWST